MVNKLNHMEAKKMKIPAAIAGYRLGLASSSPRRRELLAMLDIPFVLVDAVEVDETYPSTLAAEEVPAYLSRLKAEAYRENMSDDDIFITADTVVIVDGDVLGKPSDRDNAVAMLRRLSGRTHRVVTGVSVFTTDRMVTFSSVTDVEFAEIPDDEIRSYVDIYSPMDKAGAYGIQEWIGAIGIKSISGSFYNVMGLPVHRLWQELKKF